MALCFGRGPRRTRQSVACPKLSPNLREAECCKDAMNEGRFRHLSGTHLRHGQNEYLLTRVVVPGTHRARQRSAPSTGAERAGLRASLADGRRVEVRVPGTHRARLQRRSPPGTERPGPTFDASRGGRPIIVPVAGGASDRGMVAALAELADVARPAPVRHLAPHPCLRHSGTLGNRMPTSRRGGLEPAAGFRGDSPLLNLSACCSGARLRQVAAHGDRAAVVVVHNVPAEPFKATRPFKATPLCAVVRSKAMQCRPGERPRTRLGTTTAQRGSPA